MRSLLPLSLLAVVACRGASGKLELSPTDEGTDTSFEFTDGTGLTGAVGALEWYQLLGGYWEDGAASFGRAWWGLVEPTEVRYWDIFGDTPDACVNGLAFPPVTLIDLGAEESLLRGEDVELPMMLAADGFFEAEVGEGEFRPEAAYDVVVEDALRVPGFTVGNALRTPPEPVLLSPRLDRDRPPQLSMDELNLEWDPVGADAVLVLVERVDANGEVQETVGCRPVDDGAFTVPAEIWSEDWTSGQWVHVYLGMASEGVGVVPMNNSDSRIVGVWWALGAGLAE